MMAENTSGKYESPLFRAYPKLEKKLPGIPIGNYPTPVEEVPSLAEELGIGRLFVKRDDLTHSTYGGNKVRKLELLLAEAKRRKAKKLITFGGIGSNHALATTIHGAMNGISTISCLVPQPVTPEVKKNLLLGHHYGAELVLVDRELEMPGKAIGKYVDGLMKDSRAPFMVPPGGSSVLGAIGYVNAAFELKEQIEAGEVPEPDRIFTAVGTCGTAAGLAVGCAAAGLKTKVTGVKVTDWLFGNPVNYAALASQAYLKLHSMDHRFPVNVVTPLEVDLLTDYFGGQYGRFTEEGMHAVELMREHAGIKLEGVYTGKAFAGLIGTHEKEGFGDSTVLFWNTFNSVDISELAAQHDYHELPEEFHKIFEMPEHTLGK
ncbi:1-aminocyclopropane-1-carboxylate deaminase/D-cysteine desulfhydrase [bacterium]